MQSRVSVVLAADQRYFPGLLATVFTALASSRDRERFEFFIFDGGIDKLSKEKLEQLVVAFGNNHGIRWLVPRIEKFNGLISMNGNFLEYARLALPDLVGRPRVLWLDADLLVFRDCVELWGRSIGDALIAAASENIAFGDDVSNLHEFGIPDDASYFNTGVMVMDLDGLREFNFSAMAINFLRGNAGNYLWHDQSAINVVLHRRISELPRCFNSLNRAYLNSPSESFVGRGGYNYHFLERPKPWQRYSGEPHARIFYGIMKLLSEPMPELTSSRNRLDWLKWQFPRFAENWYSVTPKRFVKPVAMQTLRNIWGANSRLKHISGTGCVEKVVGRLKAAYLEAKEHSSQKRTLTS
ncbi:General stress protein A [Stieleria neptunia]|uniref:General stress protein A n=1 Tax=Stieleria neptunia TaxID=2527979 RepID=A0A518HKG4_9BACT|nr:glycosyltransferase family 8 protein [Stieleria neptunia]QDV41300.1 General stress protein A [Stieleria neptunia]